MRKIATGLTSVPISDVPGNENVEVKYFEPEDAQTANTSGFNQVDTSSFSDDEILEDEKNFNLKNIVSNRMKNKIKEVLGIDINKVSSTYIKRELLKLSQSIYGNEDFMQLLNGCIDELNNDIISNSTQYDAILEYPQWLSKLDSVYATNTRNMQGQGSPKLNGEQIVSISRAERASPEVKSVLLAGFDFYKKQINDKFNMKLESDSAAGATGVTKYVGSKDWGDYVRLNGRNATIKNLWERFNPSNPEFNSYKRWWKETYRTGGGHAMDVIEDLKREISLNTLDKYDRSPVGNQGYGFGPSDIIRTPLSTTSGYRNGLRKKAESNPLTEQNIKRQLYELYMDIMTDSLKMHEPVKEENAKKIIDTLAQMYSAWYVRNIPNERTNHLLVRNVFNTFLQKNQLSFDSFNFIQDKVINYFNDRVKYFVKLYSPKPQSSVPSPTRKKSTVVNDWNGYIQLDKSGKNLHTQIKELWINMNPRPSRANPSFDAYKQWWIENYRHGSGKGDANTVIQDLERLTSKKEENNAAGSTGADTQNSSAQQTQTPATPTQTSTGPMISSVTVNGKPAVAIGTAGKDLIVLTIESLNSGDPKLYRKDNRTGNVREMTSGENMQFRNSLSNMELNAIARELQRAGINSGKISGFVEYMKLQRRENRFGPIFRNRRKDNMEKAKQRMRQQNTPQ